MKTWSKPPHSAPVAEPPNVRPGYFSDDGGNLRGVAVDPGR
jgi:hypothetical protein